jgi:acyl dehydratase
MKDIASKGVAAMNRNTDTPKRLMLEDIVVGQKFVSGTHTIDAEQIKAFAAQFDPQPFHLDEAAAEKSLFGGLAASGWHTAGITMRLLVEAVPLSAGLIGAGAEIAWPIPTRPGDTLQVETEVIDITPSRSRPDRGIVTVRTITKNQNGEAVQIITSKQVVFRRREQ